MFIVTNRKSQVEGSNGSIGVRAYETGLGKKIIIKHFYKIKYKIPIYFAAGANKVTADLAMVLVISK